MWKWDVMASKSREDQRILTRAMKSFNAPIPRSAILFHITLRSCLLALVVACCMLGRSRAAEPVVSVEVHGEGSSHWEARTDCIRQALQPVAANGSSSRLRDEQSANYSGNRNAGRCWVAISQKRTSSPTATASVVRFHKRRVCGYFPILRICGPLACVMDD